MTGHLSARLRLAAVGRLGGHRFGGRRGSPGDTREVGLVGRRVIAKSVHAPLAVEWVTQRFDVDVLVVLRHPANVLASWLELDLPDRDRSLDRWPPSRTATRARWHVPSPGPEPLARMVWQLGLFTASLEEAAARHPRLAGACARRAVCRSPRPVPAALRRSRARVDRCRRGGAAGR